MKNLILLLTTFILLPLKANLQAATLPQNKGDFCARFGTSNEDRQTIQDLTSEPTSLMAFKNNGGLFNGGVCWWHSRFQRNILYLSIFRPDLPKPESSKEIEQLIKNIRLGESVITIPGYANFQEFSNENKTLIQKELNSWQIYDGVILGSWIDGLKGNTKVSIEEMQRLMSEVYEYVAVKKKIAYEKLQIKGITSHAWLIVGIKQNASGFDLGIIDSNHPNMSEVYTYKMGDQSFFVKAYGNFVPYTEFIREEEKILNAAKSFCGLKSITRSVQSIKREYELDLREAKHIN